MLGYRFQKAFSRIRSTGCVLRHPGDRMGVTIAALCCCVFMASTATEKAETNLGRAPFGPEARWIGFPGDDSDKQMEAAPEFRKPFDVVQGHGAIVRATLTISGLGTYVCSINGRRVSGDVLDPGWTCYNKTILYDTFDVTPMMHSGANAIGVTLGNGPFNVLATKGRYTKLAVTCGNPKLIAQLELLFADGTRETVGSDATWMAHRGPITFNHQYGGEDYDARLETAGWDSPGFDDSQWQRAVELDARISGRDPLPSFRLASHPPDKVCDSFVAIKITHPAPGVYIYDLGQNMSGWPRISVKGVAGAAVRIVPGELLDKEGRVSQASSGAPMWYQYTLRGVGSENWAPQFSYYGFRYVEVTGATPADFGSGLHTDGPVLESVRGEFVHANLAPAGTFSCSSSTLNRIHSVINNAILSNAQSILTDCPHREKLGWLEQSHLMAQSIMMNWNVSGFYSKIADDISDTQHPDGLVPDIAPEYAPFREGFLDSPEWGSASILSPWYAFEYYGDRTVLSQHYECMKRYAEYLKGKAKQNIIDYGLGDWYDVGPKPPGFAQLTPVALTATAVYYQDLITLQKIAAVLGHFENASEFRTQAADVKKAFNVTFFRPTQNQYADGSQTADAIPLALDLVPADRREAVATNLVNSIMHAHNRVTAGDVGFSYLAAALTDLRRGDLLYDLATQADGPGYVDQLRKGATTLTEAWDANPSCSQNHLMLGHIEAWFYRGLGGIQVDEEAPGFRHFFLRPEFPRGLQSVRASHMTNHGDIRSSWERRESLIVWSFDVPPGTTATVDLDGQKEEVGPGHYLRQIRSQGH